MVFLSILVHQKLYCQLVKFIWRLILIQLLLLLKMYFIWQRDTATKGTKNNAPPNVICLQ